MKKLILLLLAALCMLSGAAAEEEMLRPSRYAPGDEVPLRLYLTAPGLAGLQMRLCWDTSVFELPEREPELTAFFGEDAMLSMVYAEPEEGVLTIVWLRETDVTLTDVCVLEFPLRVREDAWGGVTAVSIGDCLLTDVQAAPLATQAEGAEIEIDAPLPTCTPIPAETPETAPTPEPTHTPEPVAALVWLTDKLISDEEAAPTATPGQYIPSRPKDVSDVAEVSPAPTATPAVTPAPTPVTVVIGATPVPETETDKLRLHVTDTAEGFRVELIAADVTIGGLQAVIGFDPAAATCTGAAFTDAFRRSAMVQMVHPDASGKIRLVYSSVNGYPAAGEAIFAADFTAERGTQIVLTLTGVKCTNADEALTMWQAPPQETVWRVQPMDDMTQRGDGVQ